MFAIHSSSSKNAHQPLLNHTEINRNKKLKNAEIDFFLLNAHYVYVMVVPSEFSKQCIGSQWVVCWVSLLVVDKEKKRQFIFFFSQCLTDYIKIFSNSWKILFWCIKFNS